MSEHTKGPWRCVYLPGSKQRCAAVDSPSAGVYIYLLIAKPDDMEATIERWKHDAKLIAVAPELLEAAKYALKVGYMADDCGDHCGNGCYWCDLRNCVAKAETTI